MPKGVPIVKEIAYWVILIALYYGITGWLGEEFMRNLKEFMFRDYINYARKYDLYNTLVPSWDNPVVIIIAVAMAFMMGKNAINVSRQLCGLVVALLIFRLAFLALGSADAVWPSTRFLLIGAAWHRGYRPVAVGASVLLVVAMMVTLVWEARIVIGGRSDKFASREVSVNKLKGIEEIRFAPGMFLTCCSYSASATTSDSFTDIAFLFFLVLNRLARREYPHCL